MVDDIQDNEQDPTQLDEPIELSPDELEKAKKSAKEVNEKYDRWRAPRRPYEFQWFVNSAYINGKQTSEALQNNNILNSLTQIDRRKKNIANKLWAKSKARFAKFTKSRPKPIVIPFTNDRKARLNAKQTERGLSYVYERNNQEQKYIDVVLWAQRTGKAYWWYHWNPNKSATIRTKDELTGTTNIQDLQGGDEGAGDIEIEVDSAYGVLFPDLRLSHIGQQPEIMRVRVLDVEEARARYPRFKDYLKPDQPLGSPFEFERQIAHLSGSEAGALVGMTSENRGPNQGILVKELYVKATSKYPKGRTVCVMGDIAVKEQDELPHGFSDLDNPYPCTEFVDMPQVGQAYATTFCEQLIPLQRGANVLWDKLETQIRMNTHPKVITARQARIPKGSFTNSEGEIIEYNFIPGMPPPIPWTPGAIVSDAWRMAEMYDKKFDDISQIHPSFEGKTGTAKSGFQTNLLQEASDNVHAPDARGLELSIIEASYKLRRMMKLGYNIPRLLSFSGRSSIPEVFEFSQDNIDEHAIITVQVGSALSQFKAAKIQQLMEFFEKGLLGDPHDPEVKRRVLAMIDMGGVEEFQEKAARDEDMAQAENLSILEGNSPPIPMFYEDHMVHYATHTDELKSPANNQIDPEVKKNLISHTLLHMRWINPVSAANLAMELGLSELVQPGLIPPPQPTALPAQQGPPNNVNRTQPPGQPQPGTPTGQPPGR